MLDLDSLLGMMAAPHSAGMGAPFAYVGLGPGQEFMPYFLSLLGFVGAALAAIVQWPLFRLLRWLRRPRNDAVAVDVRKPAE